LCVKNILRAKVMSVVTVDERGRLTIPKELGVRGTKAIIIPAGSFFVTIPLPTKPHEKAGSWLPSNVERKELKAMAEKSAFENAVKRAKRRKQI
jgi:bifunctional DNA-binding transcriptional regulator/antitoxin component of YhaV-PrlF toxin-antitoxin module